MEKKKELFEISFRIGACSAMIGKLKNLIDDGTIVDENAKKIVNSLGKEVDSMIGSIKAMDGR